MLPGEMASAAEGSVKSSLQISLGLSVIRVSLRASGKFVCTKEKSMGEGCVVGFVASTQHHCSSSIRGLCGLCPLRWCSCEHYSLLQVSWVPPGSVEWWVQAWYPLLTA